MEPKGALPQFHKLFTWNGEKVEDVRFWCEPQLCADAIRSIALQLRHAGSI